MSKYQHIGVVGGGAWGTALATALVRAGRDVTLWARDEDVVTSVNSHHINDMYLPNVDLSPVIKATGDLADLTACDALLWVVPVQYSRFVANELAACDLPKDVPVLLCSKGIELTSLEMPAKILEEVLGNEILVLSGPSFAREVALAKPTALTLACKHEDLGMELCHAMSSTAFRLYYSADIIGAQIGGAIKNVMAIATGIAAGSHMGENARAALITRGLAELMRLGTAMGAEQETMMGLSGQGDLVLTCSSTQSRNMSLGFALGEGQTLEELMEGRKTVAEGVPTAAAAAKLAKTYKIDMPIVDAVNAVLNEGKDVQVAIADLLARPIKTELG